MQRDRIDYDVIIVGAGPAGLSCAIHLKQLNSTLNVCILEKGAAVGSHILSGGILEPSALNELLPDWHNSQPPMMTAVTREQLWFLTERKAWNIPNFMLPKQLKNKGNYILSLGLLCGWLAQRAERLGVDIFTGFAANELLYNADDHVCGVVTKDMGLDKQGNPKDNYSAGIEIAAPITLIAEGCRGYLAQRVMTKYKLDANSDPQTYGLGVKELWEIKPEHHQPGLVIHTAQWPLHHENYGGGFIYHLDQNKVALGMVVGLDYKNPYLDPFALLQQFKTHPRIKSMLQDARRISYGARCLNEGGLQSLPQLIFPGGALLGCSAGTLNVAKIKGIHNAMHTGMLAAKAIVQQDKEQADSPLLEAYPRLFANSSTHQELFKARNFRQYFRYGLLKGTVLAGIDLKLMCGQVPWTLHRTYEDRQQLAPKHGFSPAELYVPDNKLTFDRPSSVYLANISHEENQPNHLKITHPTLPIQDYLDQFNAPEQYYCPAGVYEILHDAENKPYLQINAANCLHCKACDIKDPRQNIQWLPPEGGCGPNYSQM